MELLQQDLLSKGHATNGRFITTFFKDPAHQQDRAALLDKHDAYVRFVRQTIPHCKPMGDPYYYAVRVNLPASAELQGFWVIGLNTSWLGRKGEKSGELILGQVQIYQALGLINELADIRNDVLIALTHHPLDWMAEWDARLCRSLLHTHCTFHLRGHLHQPALNLNDITSAAGCMEIAAGAAHGDDEWFNGYNFVRVDLTTLKGVLFSRWYEPTTHKWVDDPKLSEQTTGQHEWQLPEKLKVRSRERMQHLSASVPDVLRIPETGKQIDTFAPKMMLIPDEEYLDTWHSYDEIVCSVAIAPDLTYNASYTFFGQNDSGEISTYLNLPFVAVGGKTPGEIMFQAFDLTKSEAKPAEVV